MDSFKIITSALLGAFTMIFTEHFLRFRPGLPKEYVLKADCQRTSDRCYQENREEHRIIFDKLDDLKEEIAKMPNLILQELAKK